MDLEIIIQPLIRKIEQSALLPNEKHEWVKLLMEVFQNAKQKPRRYELDKLLGPIYKVEDIIETFTAGNNRVPFKRFTLVNGPVKFSKQLHKQYKCLSDLNKLQSSPDGAEVQSKTSSKVDNYGVLEKKSYSNIIRLKKSLSKSEDAVVPAKKSSTTVRVPSTVSEDIQVFTSGNNDVGRDSSVLKDVDEGQHQSWAKTSCHREEGSVPSVLEHLASKLAQPILDVRTRQLLILETNLISPDIENLLQSAYNSYHTKHHFQFRSWVHVSNESREGNILSDILKQVTAVKQEQGLSNQLLKKRLHGFLVFKRYLIVLCGVLRDGIWDNLKSAFPYSLNGSRVILLLSGGVTLNNVSKDWSHQQLRKFSDHLQEESGTLGVKDVMNELSQSIFNPSRMLFLICIVKVVEKEETASLWAMYNAEDVKQLFQCRAWVHVSNESREGNILSDILKQVTAVEQEQGLSNQLLKKRLQDFLVFKRYLIVLYGVLRDDIWDNLKSAFPYPLNGSWVILLLSGGVTLNNVSKDWSHQQLRKFSDYLQEESGTLGVKDIMNELSQSIFNPYRMLFLISIVGVVEKEKTTLLWAMYNAEDVKQLFQCHAWVHVSEEFKERDLLAKILKQVTDNEQEEELDLEPLRLKLCNFLAQKRYLIVLYDVWSANVWDKLKLSLPNSMNGSRVILTVHETDVAQQTHSWIFGTVCGKELLREKVCNPKVKHSWERLSDIVAKESGIVGLDDKLKELAEVVLNCHTFHFLISVVGLAGSGKTALVRAFYNSLAIKQHFDCRAFVSASEVFEIRKLLADLSMQLGMLQKDEGWSKEELQQRLQIYLAWKRYLIVLDDVHTADVWRELAPAFPDPSNGSKVILTIRDAHVARHINPHTRVLQLRFLNDDESWELFIKKVPRVVGNAGLITLQDKILQRCGGLPSNIVVLGGLLSTKDLDIQVWSRVIETVHKGERKMTVTEMSLDQPASSYTKQENEKKKMLCVLTPMADQPNSLAQHASSDTKLEEEDGLGETEQVGPSEAQPNFSVQQSCLDKKQEVEVKHIASNEGQESSSNQLALSDTKKKEDGALVTETTYFDQDQSDTVDETLPIILALGYQDLDTDLKLCLNYLGLFPKSYRVPFRRLFSLLVAEGLLEQSTEESTENGQKIENSGSSEARLWKCLAQLENRNMIEVESRKLDGSPKTIFMQSNVYDALSQRAMGVGFFHIHSKRGQDTSKPLKVIRRFVDHEGISSGSLPNCSSSLRSYISFHVNNFPAFGVEIFLKDIIKAGFGLLVILDLENVYQPALPKHLSKLPNLKYLGLRYTFLERIPDSVGDLPCLQTLDLKHTEISTLPVNIWKAKKLEHLYLDDIFVEVDAPISKAPNTNGSLTNLQTLLGLAIRNGSSMACLNATKMSNLTKLGVKCYEEFTEEILRWISELSKLQSLKLSSINKSGEPSPLKLADFSRLVELSQLYLSGELPVTFDFGKFPPNLEILTLSVSELSKDPMEELGRLEKLKILRLLARSYTGETMTCQPSSFLRLRVLKLWMLPELKEWIVGEEAMPKLEKVEIRYCLKLKKPSGLERLKTLKKLVLTSMEENFVKEVKESMDSNVTIRERRWDFSSS